MTADDWNDDDDTALETWYLSAAAVSQLLGNVSLYFSTEAEDWRSTLRFSGQKKSGWNFVSRVKEVCR